MKLRAIQVGEVYRVRFARRGRGRRADFLPCKAVACQTETDDAGGKRTLWMQKVQEVGVGADRHWVPITQWNGNPYPPFPVKPQKVICLWATWVEKRRRLEEINIQLRRHAAAEENENRGNRQRVLEKLQELGLNYQTYSNSMIAAEFSALAQILNITFPASTRDAEAIARLQDERRAIQTELASFDNQ